MARVIRTFLYLRIHSQGFANIIDLAGLSVIQETTTNMCTHFRQKIKNDLNQNISFTYDST